MHRYERVFFQITQNWSWKISITYRKLNGDRHLIYRLVHTRSDRYPQNNTYPQQPRLNE